MAKRRCGPDHPCGGGMKNGLFNTFFGSSSGSSPSVSPDNSDNTDATNRQGWVIIGDSTALGTTVMDSETSAPQTYSGIVSQYNAVSTNIESVTNDLYNALSGSPWVNFAMNYYYRTGYKICYSPRGASGSEFASVGDSNNWSASGTLYGVMQSAVTNMLIRLGTTKLRGCLVMCGINDARGAVAIATIQTEIFSLVTRFQADRPGVPMYFINIGKTELGLTQRCLDIRAIIDSLPGLYSNVYVINRLGNAPFNDLMYDDDALHCSQFMNELVGATSIKNMAAASLIANTPPSITYPASVNTVIGRFSSLPTRFQVHVNNFIKYLDDAGHLSGIDSFYCPLLDNSANSLQDWIRSSKQAVLHGGVAWNNGIVLDGVDDYVDLNFLPLTDGVQFALNDNTMGAMMLQRLNSAGDLMSCIGSNTNHRSMLFENFASTNVQGFNNAGTGMTRSSRLMHSYAYYSCLRTASNATQLLENGVQLQTGTTASVAKSPVTLVYGARNNNGSILAFKNCEMGPVIFAKSSVAVTLVYRKIRELAANCLSELS